MVNTATNHYYFRFSLSSRNIELHLLSPAKLGMGMFFVVKRLPEEECVNSGLKYLIAIAKPS